MRRPWSSRSRARAGVWSLCIAVAFCIVQASSAGAARLTVRFADGRSVSPLVLERREANTDELYVAADALCDALGLERVATVATRKLVIKAGEHKLQITADTRLVMDGDTEILLHLPVRENRGALWVPLEFLERALGPALGPGAQFDRSRFEFAIGPGESDVLGVEYLPVETGTEVRVRLARPLRYRAEATSDEIVRLVLFDAKVQVLALAADQPSPLVRSARGEQSGKDATVFFEVLPPCGGVTDRAEDGGKIVVLTLLRGRVKPDVQPPAYVRPLVEVPSPSDSFDLIAIDPGHGGFDRGAQGSGMSEKDVTLRLATAIAPILEQQLGLRVLLLRANDETMAAETRAEIANRAGVDLLFSLHCNAAFDARPHGFEVLYADPAQSTAGDATLASSRRGGADFNLWNTVFLPYAERNAALAGFVQEELNQSLGSTSRGTRAAPLELLRAVAMPAVHIECGFLTNSDEAAKLAGPEFADRLAAALVAAVRSYRASEAATGKSAAGGHR